MDRLPAKDSITFEHRPRAATSELEPETIIVALAWLLALGQIALGIARGGEFGPDRAIALAFVVVCPLIAFARVIELGRRMVARLRLPIGRPRP